MVTSFGFPSPRPSGKPVAEESVKNLQIEPSSVHQTGSAIAVDAPESLVLTCLGDMRLTRLRPGAAPETLLGAGKPLALLVYLALSPQRAAGRDHLLDLLWSDALPDAARNTLRQTLYWLRKRIGGDSLVLQDGRVVLRTELTSDRDAFVAACVAGDHERAVTRYTGEFLPHFASPGAAEFEQWADRERSTLLQRFLQSTEELVRRRLADGRFREAEQLARRARDADPEREPGWRLLLECLLAANDTASAALEAAALQQLLADRERDPEPGTRALLDLVACPEPSPEGPSSGLYGDLVARQAEFGGILREWDAARAQGGRHVALTGAAGLGKTRLLTDVRRRLRSTGGRALYVRANPGERLVPYSLVAELVARLAALPGAKGVSPETAAILVGINPTVSSSFPAAADHATGAEALLRRALAVTELVGCVAEERPFALLVDDVHWADDESRHVIQMVLDDVGEHRILVVTTSRPGDGVMPATPSSTHYVLGPLEAEEVAALVVSLGPVPDEPWSLELGARLWKATGGVPLLVLETLRLALERGILVHTGGTWACPKPTELEEHLTQGAALQHRITSLDWQQRYLLLLLAVAGAPVAEELLAAAARLELVQARGALEALEQRGLTARWGGAWMTAHDAIAEQSIAAESDQAMAAAHLAIGRLLASEDADAERLLRAARYLSRSGAEEALQGVLARRILLLRRGGDRRPLALLAREALSDGGSAEDVATLVRSLPLSLRTGLYTWRRKVALIGAIAAAGTIAAFAVATSPPPDAVLYVIARPRGGLRSQSMVEVRRETWDRERPLRAVWTAALSRLRGWRAFDEAGEIRPRHDELAISGPDSSGDIELFLAGRSALHKLTSSPGDDLYPRWSPDGRRLLFATSRWDPRGDYDLAILDVETGSVRQLTRTPATERPGWWSPDETRIAFQRSYPDARPAELCWISDDGGVQRCFAPDGYDVVAIHAWFDGQQVMATVDSAGQRFLARIDIDARSVQPVDRSARAAWSSPDGRWIACLCTRPPLGREVLLAYPSDRPDMAREVVLPRGLEDWVWLTWSTGSSRKRVERLVFGTMDFPLPVGEAFHLDVRAYDESNEEVFMGPVLRWWTDHPEIAAVDSEGVLIGLSEGQTTIHVSAAGVAVASQAVSVAGPAVHRLLRENWSDDFHSRWRVFGLPAPASIQLPDGERGLWVAGDDNYASGVYSRNEYAAAGTLTLELTLSAPVNAGDWQWVRVALASFPDTSALGRWDHESGPFPFRAGVHLCAFDYPGQGEMGEPNWITLAAGHLSRRVPALPRLRTGEPSHIRIQLHSDMSCTFIIDGEVVSRFAVRTPMRGPVRVFIEGKSVGTMMVIGPLELSQSLGSTRDRRVPAGHSAAHP